MSQEARSFEVLGSATVAAPRVTAHAQTRMRQRAINPDILEALLDFGHEAFDHRGASVYYIDKRARKRIERDADPKARRKLSKLAGIYAVVSTEGEVVTVGHRFRRIARD